MSLLTDVVARMRHILTNSSLPQETKSSAVGPITTLYTADRPVWSQRDFRAYADEGFRKCIIAYGCIEKITQALKYIPLNLMKGDTKIDKHPFIDLLKRPNPHWQSTGPSLIQSLAGYLLISGNAYLEMVPEGVDPTVICDPKHLPVELYSQRADLIRVVPDKSGDVKGWEYMNNSRMFRWLVDPLTKTANLIHMKTFNPTDQFYGLAPMEAAALSVGSHNEATIWNHSLVKNGAKPSGALVYKPQSQGGANLTEDQRQALREQLEESITGAKNANRPIVLDGDFSWQQMSFSPQEMDWLNAKTTSAKEICIAFNVPPYLMGITDPTYNNAREARAMMYEDAVIPLLEFILEYINQQVLTLYEEDGSLQLEMDLNKIPALSIRRTELWTMVQNATWLTTNEKRGLTGFELIKPQEMDAETGKAVPNDPADEILISTTVTPLSSINDPPPPQLQVDANGQPLQGGEDDPDDDSDDDLSPDRHELNGDDGRNGGSGKPSKKGPPPTSKKSRKLTRKALETKALQVVLMKEFNYSYDDARDSARLAWGDTEGGGVHSSRNSNHS